MPRAPRTVVLMVYRPACVVVLLVLAVGCAGGAQPSSTAPTALTQPPVVAPEPVLELPGVEVEPLEPVSGGACAVAANPAGPWDPQTAFDAAGDLAATIDLFPASLRPALTSARAALEVVAAGSDPSDDQRAAIAELVELIGPFCFAGN
jgi:hypothetical protein